MVRVLRVALLVPLALVLVLVVAGCDGPLPVDVADTSIADAGALFDAPSDAPRTDASCATDTDRDGHVAAACGGDDCDDDDADRHPGNAETCDEAMHDEDCDLTTYGPRDQDGDGYDDAACCNVSSSGATCGDDCDDTRAGAHPSLAEVCDAFDNDCDGAVDEDVLVVVYPDHDHDGYGAGTSESRCPGSPDFAASAGDCNDEEALVSPGVPEVCDALDNDCDGAVDEAVQVLLYPDADGDGFGMGGTTGMLGCASSSGYATATGDCDDAIATIHPSAPEHCDRVDEDCSTGGGVASEEDEDDDGHAAPTATCEGGALPKDDCDDTDANGYVNVTVRHDVDGDGTCAGASYTACTDGGAPMGAHLLPCADDCLDTAAEVPDATGACPPVTISVGQEFFTCLPPSTTTYRATCPPGWRWTGDCVTSVSCTVSRATSGAGDCTVAPVCAGFFGVPCDEGITCEQIP